jgi:hypothetical protein
LRPGHGRAFRPRDRRLALKGSIGWPRVAHGGYRFAFAEATNGFASDPSFARNRVGTKAAGLAFGAFHFARPAGSTSRAVIANAVAQADFFVLVAQPQTGELAPVLDLERTGGLSPASLRAWTAAWLNEVQLQVGSGRRSTPPPTFWRKAVGDASVFASAGSNLWIAHWHVAAPPRARGELGRDRLELLAVDELQPRSRDQRLCRRRSLPRLASGHGPDGAAAGRDRRADRRRRPQTGQLLSASTGTWQADPAPTLAYQWQRCTDTTAGTCVAIPKAVTSSYTVSAADVGSTLSVVVTATSRARSGWSASTAVPANA